jgi:hypothetical protein
LIAEIEAIDEDLARFDKARKHKRSRPKTARAKESYPSAGSLTEISDESSTTSPVRYIVRDEFRSQSPVYRKGRQKKSKIKIKRRQELISESSESSGGESDLDSRSPYTHHIRRERVQTESKNLAPSFSTYQYMPPLYDAPDGFSATLNRYGESVAGDMFEHLRRSLVAHATPEHQANVQKIFLESTSSPEPKSAPTTALHATLICAKAYESRLLKISAEMNSLAERQQIEDKEQKALTATERKKSKLQERQAMLKRLQADRQRQRDAADAAVEAARANDRAPPTRPSRSTTRPKPSSAVSSQTRSSANCAPPTTSTCWSSSRPWARRSPSSRTGASARTLSAPLLSTPTRSLGTGRIASTRAATMPFSSTARCPRTWNSNCGGGLRIRLSLASVPDWPAMRLRGCAVLGLLSWGMPCRTVARRRWTAMQGSRHNLRT